MATNAASPTTRRLALNRFRQVRSIGTWKAMGRAYPLVPVEDETLLTKRIYFRVIFQTDPLPRYCARTKRELCSLYVLNREVVMLRVFVEEAAALASIGLFVGMIAMWAQLIPQL